MRGERLPALDGIRALAMLMVMYFHFWQQNWLQPPEIDAGLFALSLYPVAAGGFVGVELLFMLSGFLLYLPLARGGVLDIKIFYWKRFVRIYPCYALCVLVCGVVARAEFGGFAEWLVYTAKNLFFLNTFSPDLLFNRFNSVLWSVAVEAWFYIIFPLLAMAVRKAPRLTLAGVSSFSILYRMWALRYSGYMPLYMNQLPGVLDCFVGGMFTAYVVCELRKKVGVHTMFSVVAAAGAAIFGFALYGMYLGRWTGEGIQHYQVLLRPLFNLGGCALIGGAALSPPAFNKVVGNKALSFIALISYNLYLWHQWLSVKMRVYGFPAYITPDPHDDPAWQWRHMLLSFAFSFAVAIFTTYFYERPIGRLLMPGIKKINNAQFPQV